MKKLLIFLAIATLVIFVFVACSSKSPQPTEIGETTTVVDTTAGDLSTTNVGETSGETTTTETETTLEIQTSTTEKPPTEPEPEPDKIISIEVDDMINLWG